MENMKYAGFWIRFLAVVIDFGIFFVLLFLFTFLDLKTRSGIFRFLDFILLYGFWVYIIVATYKVQATFGKMAVGIKVIPENTKKLGLGKVIVRETIGKIISSIFWIGFIMAGFSDKKQGLHDRIAGTYVVYK